MPTLRAPWSTPPRAANAADAQRYSGSPWSAAQRSTKRAPPTGLSVTLMRISVTDSPVGGARFVLRWAADQGLPE